MSEKPISPLRQRLLEDMNMRRFVPDTQREYIRAVKKFASFLGRSPDSATPEELRAFQLHLTDDSRRPPSGQVGGSSQQPLVFGWAAHFALTCLMASSS
jgi:hypothetical protein